MIEYFTIIIIIKYIHIYIGPIINIYVYLNICIDIDNSIRILYYY